MTLYYINTRARQNGDHEVHRAGCLFMPTEARRMVLGEFENGMDAVLSATRLFRNANGCFYCSSECHHHSHMINQRTFHQRQAG